MGAQVCTGVSIRGEDRQRAIDLLALGYTVNRVASELGVSWETVDALARVEFDVIRDRKPYMQAQAEHGARIACNALVEAVESKEIKGAQLVSAYGVLFDKALLARGESVQRIDHRHVIEIRESHRQLCDALVSAASLPAPKVIEAEVVRTRTTAKNGPGKTRATGHNGAHSRKKSRASVETS